MKELGRIVRLQVQRDSIKTSTGRFETYTAAPNLTSVQILQLNADGVQGIDAHGDIIPDVHNATHPRSKYRGDNGVSIGFTSHYASMRERYGDHLGDGMAGENIIVACAENVPLEMIESGIVIVGGQGEIVIGPWIVIHPCSPFAKYCLQLPGESTPGREVTETLQFLENGMRGFSAVYGSGLPPVEIRVGDAVYALE